jgi:hypothetical protein
MRPTTIMTPEEVHLGLYKREEDETRGEAIIAPRKVVLTDVAMAAEVHQVVGMAEFIFAENEANKTEDLIELQCTTMEVEKLVRKQLGKRAKRIRFLPPKVAEIRGQYGR